MVVLIILIDNLHAEGHSNWGGGDSQSYCNSSLII